MDNNVYWLIATIIITLLILVVIALVYARRAMDEIGNMKKIIYHANKDGMPVPSYWHEGKFDS